MAETATAAPQTVQWLPLGLPPHLDLNVMCMAGMTCSRTVAGRPVYSLWGFLQALMVYAV